MSLLTGTSTSRISQMVVRPWDADLVVFFFCNLARSQSRYRSSGTNKQEGGRQRPLRKVSYCYMDSTLTE